MPQANVTLPDGTKARVTFDTPEQLDAAVNDLNTQVNDRTTDKLGVPHPGEYVSRALGEPTLKVLSGMAGAAAGGVAGIARGAGAGAAALAHGEGLDKAKTAFVDEAASTIHGVEEAMTRQPRTTIGRAADKVVSKPFELLAEGADIAGEKTAEVTGSPAAGAAVNTLIQAAPGAVVGALRGKAKPVGGAKADPGPGPVPRETLPGADPNEVPPITPPKGPAAAQEAPGAGQPSGAPGGRPAGEPAAGATEQGGTPQERRARAYAGNLGLDWSRMGAGVRAALTTIAEDASALERLNPDAVKRQATLGSLRVPMRATRGQLERDPVQLRREAIASNTAEGQPIRDIDVDANRDLQANLEALRGRVGGMRGGLHEPINAEGVPAAEPSIRAETKTPSQVGESGQGALRGKAKWSKKGYQALFKAARETEPTAKTAVEPINELLRSNPEIQHLGWVSSWLNKARSLLPRDGETGEAPPLTEATLAELHDLRSSATDIARTGGKEGHYAGKVVAAVDQAMEGVPEGAAAWKRAIGAFRKHQEEFKDQDIIRKLTSQKKGGADRTLALEKTWQTVATGPLEQVRQVKRSLMTGGTGATRMAGRKAWRDLRAETVNRILEDARNVTAADETERAVLTEAALRRSLKRIPRENLEELLGKRNVRELNDILRARRITTRSPVGGRTTQSGTVPNALVMFEKVLKHIPGVKYAVGAKHAMQELGERGAASRTVEQATVSPLEQAVQDLERSGPTITPAGVAGPAPGTVGALPQLKRP